MIYLLQVKEKTVLRIQMILQMRTFKLFFQWRSSHHSFNKKKKVKRYQSIKMFLDLKIKRFRSNRKHFMQEVMMNFENIDLINIFIINKNSNFFFIFLLQWLYNLFWFIFKSIFKLLCFFSQIFLHSFKCCKFNKLCL